MQRNLKVMWILLWAWYKKLYYYNSY